MINRFSKVFFLSVVGAAVACSDNGSSQSPGQGGASMASSGASGSTATGSSGSSASTTSGGGAGSSTSGGTAGTTGSGGTGGSAGATSGGGGPVDGGTGMGGSGGAGGTTGAGGSGGSNVPDAGRRSGFVYVSGYGGSIATFAFDATQATLTPRGSPTSVANASFLAWGMPAKQLFALSEEVPAGKVFGFTVNPTTGALTATNNVSSGGAGPAHLMVDPSGKWVLVANYDGGTAAVLGVQPNGNLVASAPGDIQMFGGSSETHAIVLDPTGQYAFVPLKGSDAVAQFRFDGTTGKLTPGTPARVMTTNGAGPRHIAFHPSSKFAYVITEQASTMVAYTHNAGALTEIQSLSTRAGGGGGSNAPGVCAVHPTGKWLYGSNRGDANIVQYSINEADGRMTLVGHTPSGGNTPRHFSIDPSGQFLFVANQGSNNVVVFRIGAADGKLTRAGNPTSVPGNQPTFVALAIP